MEEEVTGWEPAPTELQLFERKLRDEKNLCYHLFGKFPTKENFLILAKKLNAVEFGGRITDNEVESACDGLNT